MVARSVCLTLALMLCVACSVVDGERSDTNTSPALDTNWQLHLTRSGGFAGEVREFHIEGSTGRFTSSDRVRNSVAQRTLTTSQRREIGALIAAAPTTHTERISETCADCLVYELQLTRAGQTHTARYDSLTLPASPHEPLIMSVIRIEQIPNP